MNGHYCHLSFQPPNTPSISQPIHITLPPSPISFISQYRHLSFHPPHPLYLSFHQLHTYSISHSIRSHYCNISFHPPHTLSISLSIPIPPSLSFHQSHTPSISHFIHITLPPFIIPSVSHSLHLSSHPPHTPSISHSIIELLIINHPPYKQERQASSLQ